MRVMVAHRDHAQFTYSNTLTLCVCLSVELVYSIEAPRVRLKPSELNNSISHDDNASDHIYMPNTVPRVVTQTHTKLHPKTLSLCIANVYYITRATRSCSCVETHTRLHKKEILVHADNAPTSQQTTNHQAPSARRFIFKCTEWHKSAASRNHHEL